jgi:hypothetical protein
VQLKKPPSSTSGKSTLVALRCPDALLERVDRVAGDNRSDWIIGAIELRLEGNGDAIAFGKILDHAERLGWPPERLRDVLVNGLEAVKGRS